MYGKGEEVTSHKARAASPSVAKLCRPFKIEATEHPSRTVTGSPSKLLIFVSAASPIPRLASVRECARLQCLFCAFSLHSPSHSLSFFHGGVSCAVLTAFPDDWSFAGGVCSQYQQIGVCLLAHTAATHKPATTINHRLCLFAIERCAGASCSCAGAGAQEDPVCHHTQMI